MPTAFNGDDLSLHRNGAIRMTQNKKNKNRVTPATERRCRCQRALVLHIGVDCRPDSYATGQLLTAKAEKLEDSLFS